MTGWGGGGSGCSAWKGGGGKLLGVMLGGGGGLLDVIGKAYLVVWCDVQQKSLS